MLSLISYSVRKLVNVIKPPQNVIFLSAMSIIPNWPINSPSWTNETLSLLISDVDIVIPPTVTVDEIIEKSKNFSVKFPIDSIRCKSLKTSVDGSTLARNINSAYPVIHENVLYLCALFILHKRQYGSDIEKAFYKDMSLLQLVQRLLTKRAVMFVGGRDKYMLLNGEKGIGNWKTIGTCEEQPPLELKTCLSYDEIKLSAFLSVSSYTYFINDGSRRNLGKAAKTRGNIQPEGIIIGLIGARMEAGKMETEEIVIQKEQNTQSNGYGSQQPHPTIHTLLASFYEEPCFTFDEASKKFTNEPERFLELSEEEYFDNFYYAKRIALSIDTLLVEANDRAKERGTSAFVHVVGIGLGVWMCSPHQEDVLVETFGKRIAHWGSKLSSISDIHFVYFGRVDSCLGHSNNTLFPIENHPNGGIKIFFSKREPHTKLTGEDENKLLIVSYAWDGNALPGNEFWMGQLAASGDPAAACSTQIAELHNPHINSKVCAENLKIVTQKGIVSFKQYCQNIIKLKL